MSENKPAGQFPIPGLAIVVLLLGVWAISDPPFKPSRPDRSPDLTSAAEDVSARLWEDPMEAVELHRSKKHTPEKDKEQYYLKSTLKENAFFEDEHHRLCGDPTRNYSDSLRGKSAHTIHELRCQIQRDVTVYSNKKFDVQILAVMIPGGPYAENRETRIRSRYAVVTGLSNNGYTPKDAEHIGYIDFADLCRLSLEGKMRLPYCDWPATIPYEWFVVDKPAQQTGSDDRLANTVLVLWIDEDEIAAVKPLKMLTRLSDALDPGYQEAAIRPRDDKGNKQDGFVRTRLDVIGPASSTSLIKMYREVSATVEGKTISSAFGKDGIRLVSPRVTIDELAIKKQLDLPENKSLDDLLKFNRTIATDQKLVENLLCELLRRGVNPYHISSWVAGQASACTEYSISSLNRNKRQDHIVLIGEWDTVYSRNFNDLFSRLISGKECYSPPWLHRYNYLRGIDGATSSDKKSTQSKSDDEKQASRKPLRRAIGENQFDYLRRLGDELENLSDRVIDEKGTIRAIGIVGSDTYDKLLILQALRARFSDVVFFTTDLDARMLHHEENKWARNLVVASGYGLVPEGDNIRFEGLPFRDSYQTSLYLTIHDLVNKDQLGKNRCMPVKIFEIGNSEAVDYSHKGQCSPAVSAGDVAPGAAVSGAGANVTGGVAEAGFLADVKKILEPDSKYFYLLLSAVLFILLIIQTSNESRRYVLLLAIVVYTMVALVNWLEPENSVEYQNMFSGTSIWPAILIRMLAGVLAFMFIFYVLYSLRRNNNRIIISNELESFFGIREGFVNRVCDDLKELNRKKNKVYPHQAVRVLFKESIKSIRTYFSRRVKKADNSCDCETPGFISRLCVTLWGWKLDKNSTMPIEQLVYQYFQMGRTLSWLPRVLIMLAIYIILTMLFMRSFSTPPFTPFNDGLSADASMSVIWFAVLSYLFLVFLVVDVTRLNSQFVELLSRYSFKWPKDMISKYCSNYGVNEDVATEKLKLDLIVRRTKTVDVLIFLPFVVLSLMILSRSNYFDRWHMPVSLAFVILLGALIALSSAIRLRRTARRARMVTLNKLDDIYRKQLYNQSKQEVAGTTVSVGPCTHMMPERIQVVMDDIRNINAGPFVPLSRHPIVAAIAMPFGGVGGLYLIEYLTSVGL